MKHLFYRTIASVAGLAAPFIASAQPVIGGWTSEALNSNSYLGGSSSFNSGLNFNSSGNGSGSFGPVGELPNPLGISTLGELVDKVSNALLIVAVPVVTAMIMWGAFKIVTAGSDPKQVGEGGKIIRNAAIGFVLLLLASGITQVIQSLFA